MTSACAPASSLLADGVAVAAAGETRWLDRTAPIVAGVAPDAGDVTLEATVDTSEATTWVLLGEETAGAGGGGVPTTEVVDVPRVGKFGF